ncbi:MAG: histidine kinase [Pseudonocardiaceae bacterium]
MSAPAGVAVPLRGSLSAGSRPPSSRAVLSLVVLGVAFGAAVLVAADRNPTSTTRAFSGAVGGLFLLAGLVAQLRSPVNRVGLLMVLVGVGWFAEDVQLVRDPVVHTAGLLLTSASSGFLVHLVLAFPTGRLGSRVGRLLVAAAYGTVFGVVPLRCLVMDDSYHRNLLFLGSLPWVDPVPDYVGVGIAVGLLAVLVRRWVSAGPPMRRVLAPVYLTGLVGGAASALGPLTALPGLLLYGIYHTALVLLPLAFLAGVWRVRLRRTALAELLMRLDHPGPDELRDLLARALGDPSVEVAYWRPDRQAYLDRDGRPLVVAAGRALTAVERDGHRVAVLVHDPALREDPHVLDAVTAAAALELDNQRLTAEVRAQLAEVRASRARIVAAADEQRRRVERDLHDGAQQQLVTAALTLRLTQQRLDRHPDPELAALLNRAAKGLADALAELRELACGIHPAILTDAGLLPALRALVQRAPGPVELAENPVPRLPAPVEATAYFVVAEALTNALKHAHAARIRVSVSHAGTALHVTVEDDGVGGADIAGGSGLLGLLDRVRAVDGDLTVLSPPGEGTSVHAILPAR